MSLTMPYGQNHYMGECATESAALVWIRDNKWDSAGNGTGNPQAGMAFFDTGATKLKVHDGSAWVALGSATPAGSTGYVQFNNAGALAGDAAFFWDNTNKRLGIGCTDPVNAVEISKDTANTSMFASVFSSSTNYASVYVQRGRGTRASKSAVQSGDRLGQFGFAGYYDTSNNYGCAFVAAYATENWGAGARGSDLRFELTAATTATVVERMRITSAGNVFIGTTAGVSVSGTTQTHPLIVYGTDSGSQFNGIISEGGACPGRFNGHRHNGTYGTKTAVATTQNLLGINAFGWDGGTTPTYVSAAAITFAVDGTVSEDSVPGQIIFYTREVGNTVSPYQRMVITNNGKVGIANNAPSSMLTLGTNGTIGGKIDLLGATSGTCSIQVAAAAGTTTFQLPADNGTNGYYLKTNGSGVTSWAAVSATPAGSSYQIQYNNAGAFGATSDFYWENTHSRIWTKGDQKYTGYYAVSYSTGGTGEYGAFAAYRYGGTAASPAAVSNGMYLGGISMAGAYDATNTSSAWALFAIASGTWSSGSMPSYLQLLSRNTSTNQYQIMRWDYGGNVAIGTHTTATERLDLQDGSGNGAIRVGNTAASNAGTIKYASGTFSGYNGSTWVTFSGGGTPAGSTGYVQFNNAGAFGADAAFFWDNTNKRLGIGTTTPSVALDVQSSVLAQQIMMTAVSSTTGSTIVLYKSRGNLTTKTATQSGDDLGQVVVCGYGTGWMDTAAIKMVARETFTAVTGKTDVIVQTCASGTTVRTEIARFHGNGLHIGAGAPTVEWPLYVSRDSHFPEIAAVAHSVTASHGGYYYAGHTRGTRSAPTATQSGDLIGSYAWIGYGSSGWVVPAQIQAYADEAYTNSTAATHMRFLTTPSGSATAVERMRIVSDGKVRIGGYTPVWELQVSKAGYCGIASVATTNTAEAYGYLVVGRSRGTSDTSPSVVQSGDSLGGVNFCGYESGYQATAQILSVSTQTWSTGNLGTILRFSSTATGSSTLTERMRITADGGLAIGTTSTSYPVDAGTNTYRLVVSGTPATDMRGNIIVESGADASRLMLVRCNGTVASKTAVVAADNLGALNLNGWDGAKYVTAAQILGTVEGTVSTSIVPAVLRFTTMNTSGTLAERMRITSGGYVVIGATTASRTLTGTGYTANLLVSTDASGTHLGGIHVEATAAHSGMRCLRANGTLASKTIVASGDAIAGFQGWGYDGTDYEIAGAIYIECDGTPGSNDMPGRIVFKTTPDGLASYVERMRITSAGLVGIANTAPSALLTLGTAGTTAGSLSLAGATSGTCTIQVAAVAGTVTFQLPASNGTSGQFLQTNGSGVTSWTVPAVLGLTVPGSDHGTSGTTIAGTAGEGLAIGDVAYLKSDGKWWKADADAQATADGLLGMATAAISTDASGVFLLHGLYRDDTWNWTVGGRLYVGATPGNPTQTAPSTTGQIQRIVGYALTADVACFCPDTTFVELS